MKKQGKRFGVITLILAVIFFLYILLTAVFPYIRKEKVTTAFQESVDVKDYYGNTDTPSVDRVALVEAPLSSLETRIHLMNEAESTLDIAYYTIEAGDSSNCFLAAVLDAADRGVKVRFILDGLSGGLSGQNKHLGEALGSHPNIELKIYNQISLFKPWTINGRMHDKYIIIDDKLLLLGGRNIGDKYFNPAGFEKNLSIDRDVLVYNSAYAQGKNRESVLFTLRDYMDTVWQGEHTCGVYEKETEQGQKTAEMLRNLLRETKEKYPKMFQKEEDYTPLTVATYKVSLLANDVQIIKKAPKLGYILSKLLLSAKEKVLLQSPYVVLDKNFETVLTKLGEKGIDYEILTNSMASTPNFPAYSAYYGDRNKILATGAKIYEFQDHDAIHAKTYLVDERLSLVGSFNLDPRSAYIDTELLLAIDSPAFYDILHGVIAQYQDHSLVVASDGTYVPSETVTEVPVSRGKKLLIAVVAFVMKPFKFLV